MNFIDRDALTAHLSLLGWVPVINSAGEHGILHPVSGLAFLAWKPDGREGYGSGWQSMRITPHLSTKSSIRECEWGEVSQAELDRLITERLEEAQ